MQALDFTSQIRDIKLRVIGFQRRLSQIPRYHVSVTQFEQSGRELFQNFSTLRELCSKFLPISKKIKAQFAPLKQSTKVSPRLLGNVAALEFSERNLDKVKEEIFNLLHSPSTEAADEEKTAIDIPQATSLGNGRKKSKSICDHVKSACKRVGTAVWKNPSALTTSTMSGGAGIALSGLIAGSHGAMIAGGAVGCCGLSCEATVQCFKAFRKSKDKDNERGKTRKHKRRRDIGGASDDAFDDSLDDSLDNEDTHRHTVDSALATTMIQLLTRHPNHISYPSLPSSPRLYGLPPLPASIKQLTHQPF